MALDTFSSSFGHLSRELAQLAERKGLWLMPVVLQSKALYSQGPWNEDRDLWSIDSLAIFLRLEFLYYLSYRNYVLSS